MLIIIIVINTCLQIMYHTYNFVIDKIKPSLQKARKLTKEANHGFI